MPGKIHVSISEKPLNIQDAYDFVADPAHGAVNSFVGAVRENNMERIVTGITYDIFEPLALRTMEDMCATICDKFGGRINIYLSHFKGKLSLGGISVIIAVSTPHRAESFEACRLLIEELKHTAPIWKQEHYTDGNSDWVKGHALCTHSKAS